ncbi:MAG: ClbS/DfsB family four-helix bundle protein [Pseudomonadota bacterium]
MPAALSKKELLATTRAEFDKLRATIAQIEDGEALTRDEDDTSVKDVIAHRAHWVNLFLGWYRDGQDGKEVFFPAKGYKWNQLKDYNRDLREKQQELGWADALARLDSAHEELCSFIEATSEHDLYGAPMKGANSNWTAGRWAEASGSSHYRSATKYVRNRLRSL